MKNCCRHLGTLKNMYYPYECVAIMCSGTYCIDINKETAK